MVHGPVNFLERFLDPLAEVLTPEIARKILSIHLDPPARERALYLAERANQGLLTNDERAENEAYIDAADLIGVLKSKARAVISGHRA